MKISELPEEYKQLALKYREENKKAYNDKFSLDVAKAFSWRETYEGEYFWYCVYEAKTIEDLPPLPQKKKSEWNLVSEKEPPEGVLLVVADDESFRGMHLATYKGGKFAYYSSKFLLERTPTHWFAVPDLPD